MHQKKSYITFILLICIGMVFLDDSLMVSVFGKNLKDQPTIGGDTQLPFFPGATFSPLNKGRVWGAEVQYIYE